MFKPLETIMGTDKIIAEINRLRRSSKGGYSYSKNHLHIKGFGTCIQRMKIDGYKMHFRTEMDLSVSEFTTCLDFILTIYPPDFLMFKTMETK